jgi:uncharacterized phiE125 gp8 family phage protein
MSFDRLARVEAPEGAILDLDTVKAHLRVEHSDEDELIEGYMAAAEAWIDGPVGIGRALLTQQWRLRLDMWPGVIKIPLGPVQSVDGIQYVGLDGSTQTLDPAAYIVDLDSDPSTVSRQFGISWPSPRLVKNAVTVTFTCGFGDAATDVPRTIVQAMLLLVSHWFRNRDAVVGVDARDSSTELPLGVSALLDPWRAGSVA